MSSKNSLEIMNLDDLTDVINFISPQKVYNLACITDNLEIREYIENQYTNFICDLVKNFKTKWINLLSHEKEHFDNLSYFSQKNGSAKVEFESYKKMSADYCVSGIWSFCRYNMVFDENNDQDAYFCAHERSLSARCLQFLRPIGEDIYTRKYDAESGYISDDEDYLFENAVNVNFREGLNPVLIERCLRMDEIIHYVGRFHRAINNECTLDYTNRPDGIFYHLIMFNENDRNLVYNKNDVYSIKKSGLEIVMKPHKFDFLRDKNYYIWEHKKKWEKLLEAFYSFLTSGLNEENKILFDLIE